MAIQIILPKNAKISVQAGDADVAAADAIADVTTPFKRKGWHGKAESVTDLDLPDWVWMMIHVGPVELVLRSESDLADIGFKD